MTAPAVISHQHTPGLDLGSILRNMAATPKQRIAAGLALRPELGFGSVTALAAALEMNTGALHTYLDGKRGPDTPLGRNLRARIAEILGVAQADIWPETPTDAAGAGNCRGPEGSCGAKCSCGQSAPPAASLSSQPGN